MAITSGTQTNIGIGVETTPGTAVAATHFPKWAELSMQAVVEKELFASQRGVRNTHSDSMIKRSYAQGDIAVIPNVDIAPLFFYPCLGTKVTTGAGPFTHTFTVNNTNAAMKTLTILVEDGAIVTERFTNCVVNTLNLEVSDSYAKLTAGLIGKAPDTGTVTESFAQESEFAYHQMTVKFGTTIAGVGAAVPLKGFTLNINNNVLLDEAFLSGSNTIASGGLVAGRMQVTGSYTLHYTDTVELAKYKANTKNACQVAFTQGADVITINLGRLILTSPPKEYNLDGVIVLTQEFAVEFEATDKEITVIIINDTASYA